MRLIAIGGEPGTGKSALVSGLLAGLRAQGRPVRLLRSGLVRAMVFDKDRLVVLGVYDGEPYPGTDRLSMAAQPQVLQFCRSMARRPQYEDWNVLFEGDRLFNVSFLLEVREIVSELTVIILLVSDAERTRRYGERGSNQSAAFIKGRQTKVANVRLTLEGAVTVLPNEDVAARTVNTLKLRQLLGLENER